ncbi:MAG: D-glycerate dehydrogenase [Anaerolineaceae bacterium]|nr:D-glycerate dehydrogenase [Anaerolineaceae bacterium]
MDKPKIFLTRKINPGAEETLRRYAEVEIWTEQTPPTYETIIEKMHVVDGILTMLCDKIDRLAIEQAQNLRVISQMAVGFDNIDIQAATAKKIPVGHTPGVLTETTADMAWGLLMAVARRIVEGNNEVHQGIWRSWGPDVLCGQEVYGSTLGIIGFGRIGQAMARRAAGFNMNVLYHDLRPEPESENKINARFVTLDELIAGSDFISVHTYLSDKTRHMISRPQFKQMKKTAMIINTARGPIIDQDALIWALENRIIAGAGLDVTDPEPISVDSPLLKMSNVVVTPHIASASTITRERMAYICAENLLAGLRGEQLRFTANPAVYD